MKVMKMTDSLKGRKALGIPTDQESVGMQLNILRIESFSSKIEKLYLSTFRRLTRLSTFFANFDGATWKKSSFDQKSGTEAANQFRRNRHRHGADLTFGFA